MCGKIISSTEILAETKQMVRNRGPDKSVELKINDLNVIYSILYIRKKSTKNFVDSNILFCNGEICDKSEESDTDFIIECLKNTSLCKEGCFCVVNKIYNQINSYENEIICCFFLKTFLCFFKVPTGRKSFGFTINENFYAGSVGFDNEISPDFFYMYSTDDKKMYVLPKKNGNECRFGLLYYESYSFSCIEQYKNINYYHYDDSQSLKDKAFILEELLIESCKKRLHSQNVILFFSGGIDSMLLVILFNKLLPVDYPIYLINTSFYDKSWDRKYGINNYKALCTVYPNRKYTFIRNDVSIDDVKSVFKRVKALIYPRMSIMDMNIGLCHFFSAKKAKEYGKVVYAGLGADELFGG